MRTDYPQVDAPFLREFASLAERFCTLVDICETQDTGIFLQHVHRLLPALYSGGLALPSTDILFENNTDEEAEDESDESMVAINDIKNGSDRVEHDEWQRLFDSLAIKLGPHCCYREIFDPYEPKEATEVMGSLADDIADIYRDLRSGLLKWRRGETGNALWEWRFHFECHWGEHATSALKALWAWAAWHDGKWPAQNSD